MTKKSKKPNILVVSTKIMTVMKTWLIISSVISFSAIQIYNLSYIHFYNDSCRDENDFWRFRLEKINSTNHLPQFVSTSKQNNTMNAPRFPIRIELWICCLKKSSNWNDLKWIPQKSFKTSNLLMANRAATRPLKLLQSQASFSVVIQV